MGLTLCRLYRLLRLWLLLLLGCRLGLPVRSCALCLPKLCQTFFKLGIVICVTSRWASGALVLFHLHHAAPWVHTNTLCVACMGARQTLMRRVRHQGFQGVQTCVIETMWTPQHGPYHRLPPAPPQRAAAAGGRSDGGRPHGSDEQSVTARESCTCHVGSRWEASRRAASWVGGLGSVGCRMAGDVCRASRLRTTQLQLCVVEKL